MNKASNKYSFTLSIIIALLLTSCKQNVAPVKDSEPLAANLVGKWQWVKTVTSTGEISPQTVRYSKSLSYGNDGSLGGNYLLISRDGSKNQVLYQNNAFGSTDSAERSLTAQFGSQYIKFTLMQNSDNTYQEMIASDLVDNYTKDFGNVQHYYRRAGAPDKP